LSHAAAASALQWGSDAGVDVLVGETPRDWLRPKKTAAPHAEAPQAAPAAPTQELPGQLDLFQAWLRDSDSLSFASPSAPRVCPSGDPASGLMMITDMPAVEDCSAGALLSGEVGRLFDRMLAAIGRDRNSIYLASLACFRSPDGRFTDPTATQCSTLARHHIGLVAPKAVLILGDAASKALLGLPTMKARGRWHEISTHAGPIQAVASFPPSYLLDQPSAKAAAWADLQLLMQGMNR
jgi:DNA polymerase